MNETILVTGSSGFIAFHTIKLLLQQGYKVVGIDDHNDSTSVLLKQKRLSILQQNPQYEFVLGSITDQPLLESIFKKYHFSGIINLAARAGVRASVKNPKLYVETNEIGLLNLLSLAHQYNISKLVQASTSSVYDGESMPFLESSASNRPISPYAASKKAAEGHAYVYHYLYNTNISVMRFFTVYGPFGRPDMSIFRFIKWIYEEKPLQVNGDGSQTRDFTYVEDIAQGIILGLQNAKGFEIFNIGNNQAYSLLEMISFLENLLGKKAQLEFFPKDSSDTMHTHANINKISQNFNWQPITKLPDGLAQTVDWFLADYNSWIKNIEI